MSKLNRVNQQSLFVISFSISISISISISTSHPKRQENRERIEGPSFQPNDASTIDALYSVEFGHHVAAVIENQ
jgi:hypothetical protein